MPSRWRSLLLLAIGTIAVLAFLMAWIRMSESGKRALTTNSAPDRSALELELQRTVQHLAETIGERNLDTEPALTRSAEWIAEQLSTYGYDVRWQRIERGGHRYANL